MKTVRRSERALVIPPSSIQQPSATETFECSGSHLIASYVDCDPIALRDNERLLEQMQAAISVSGATILKSSHHIFPTGGMTALMLLSESHASIHTYPEYNACFIDLFTCGGNCHPANFDAVLRAYLKPVRIEIKTLLREIGSPVAAPLR